MAAISQGSVRPGDRERSPIAYWLRCALPTSLRKSLGSKRKELSPDHIDTITRLFGNFVDAE
jgi:hypothetical protein